VKLLVLLPVKVIVRVEVPVLVDVVAVDVVLVVVRVVDVRVAVRVVHNGTSHDAAPCR